MTVRARKGYYETLLLANQRVADVWEDADRIVLAVTVGAAAPLSVDLAPHEARAIAGLLRRATEGDTPTAEAERDAAIASSGSAPTSQGSAGE